MVLRLIGYLVAVVLVGLAYVVSAYPHEHMPGETAEQKQVVDFLQQWRRPKGKFVGIEHRFLGCCYSAGPTQDCFAVKEERTVNGVKEVLPDFEGHTQYDKWYKVNTGVNEDLQPDPKESPDGRSYVCIQGDQVVCFVEGAGA